MRSGDGQNEQVTRADDSKEQPECSGCIDYTSLLSAVLSTYLLRGQPLPYDVPLPLLAVYIQHL